VVDLIIIGGGASALAAATYALGKQLDFVMVYEHLGGKSGWRQHLVNQEDVEHLPDEEAARLLERRVARAPAHLCRDRVVHVHRVAGGFAVDCEHHGPLQARAVIVATGARPTPLPVPGAAELLGQGLGYSITTHAHLLAGKRAAVLGSTVRALRGAAELAQRAAQVYLIVPTITDMAAPMVRVLADRDNVEVLPGYRVTEVVGPMNVEALVVARDGATRRLVVDAAFVDIGLVPNSSIVAALVETDDAGFIRIDQRNATSVPGIFAAGDVATMFGEQVLIAIGEGARAALAAYDYLLAQAPVAAEGAD